MHTPQLPPSREQCLQYLQFLQARQEALPVHVAAQADEVVKVRMKTKERNLSVFMHSTKHKL